MRPWWNRQTRYFEGVVGIARVSSSLIGLTIVIESSRLEAAILKGRGCL